MYSNEDLERFYFKYQTEALPHGQSLQSFCLNNNVPYNLFSKWYRDSRRKRPSKFPLNGDFLEISFKRDKGDDVSGLSCPKY